MGSTVIINKKKPLPIRYTCISCGAENLDLTTVTAEGRANAYRKNSREEAAEMADQALQKKIDKITHDVNEKYHVSALTCEGKCRQCGVKQPWATGTLQHRMRIIFLIIGFTLSIVLSFSSMLGNAEATMSRIFAAVVMAFFIGCVFYSVLWFGIRKPLCVFLAKRGSRKMKMDGKMECFPVVLNSEKMQ